MAKSLRFHNNINLLERAFRAQKVQPVHESMYTNRVLNNNTCNLQNHDNLPLDATI